MLKRIYQYPINYLISVVTLYSIYDYFEHIGRNGTTYNEHPWYWLLFTTSAILSFLIIVILSKKILQKLLNRKNLIIEVLAIGIWLGLYLLIVGPAIDQFFWPFEELKFRFRFGPFFVVLIGYFTIRLVINLIARKKALYSN